MNVVRIITVCVGLLFVEFVRLVQHIPNTEPIMGTMMPYAKRFGWLTSTLFSFFAIFLYDTYTGSAGVWTYATALSYAFVGLLAGFYFKTRNTVKDYLRFAFIGTITYDLLTGVFFGPVLFGGMTYAEAFVGQIPFTAWHLLSNVLLAATLAPAVEWVLKSIEFHFESAEHTERKTNLV